jgi:hypothetical protein
MRRKYYMYQRVLYSWNVSYTELLLLEASCALESSFPEEWRLERENLCWDNPLRLNKSQYCVLQFDN